ncbi:ATP-binding cassette domain-containing protein [Pseudarthrobacter sp. So.54]
MRSPKSYRFVELDAVAAGYGRGPAVVNISQLILDKPGIVHLHGPNGSGKSTLVEVLSGYLRTTSGRVLVNGMAAAASEAHERRRICRTEPALYPMMNVRDHLIFASRWCGADPGRALARAADYGLGPWLEAPAETLSTGNRRRLWIIQCTVGDFDTLVLDEPFNGLDGESTAVLIGELEGWAASRCIVLIAHQPPERLRIDQAVAWEELTRGHAAPTP